MPNRPIRRPAPQPRQGQRSIPSTRSAQQRPQAPRRPIRQAPPRQTGAPNSYAYRNRTPRRQRKQRRTLLFLAGAAVLCLLAGILLFGGKGNASLPAGPAPLPGSSTLYKVEMDPEYIRAYNTALTVRLINFDHPNYDDPKKLVTLRDLLPQSVTVNSGANQLEEEAALALQELFTAAEADGITTYIVNSAYRDRTLQQSFWDNRLAKDPHYGDNVYENPVKTVPATASEHCTGLAVDILCDSVPHGTADYQHTKEAKWLADNAHKFGFILRYPDGAQSVTGVMYEAWHYRYVGKEAAADIYKSGLCLEEYLASFGLPLASEQNPSLA